MTKKILALVLSLALVIGLVPMMSVSAEEETSPITPLYEEDFTNFENQSYNADYALTGNTSFYVTNKESVNRMQIGAYCKADIVNMAGFDGNNTNALKITVNPNLASFSPTAGAGRWTIPGLSAALGDKTSGALVYQLKMYIPEADSAGNRQDINGFVMAPVVKSGNRYGVGTSARDAEKNEMIDDVNPGEWYDLTYVVLLDEQKVLVYCNDVISHYKTETVAAGGYRFQMHSIRNAADEHIIFDDIKVWHIAAKSADDPSPQSITTASSDYANSNSVAITANPTVKFSEVILNRQTVTTVSTDNVVMTKADDVDNPISVESVTVGNDKKSIVINPTENLKPGTAYNVKVTGLYDMYDELIPDYEFSFTTAESISVELNAAPSFKKANIFSNIPGTELTALENGYINVKYTLKNTSATKECTAVLLTVLRDGGDIKYFQFENGAIAPGAELSFDGSFMVDDAESQTIETYVWDSLSGAAALADKYIISKDGITNVSVENQ